MKLTQFAVDDGPHNSDGLLVDVLLSDITESGETRLTRVSSRVLPALLLRRRGRRSDIDEEL